MFVELENRPLQNIIKRQIFRAIALKGKSIYQNFFPLLTDVKVMPQIFEPLPDRFEFCLVIFYALACYLLMHFYNTVGELLIFLELPD